MTIVVMKRSVATWVAMYAPEPSGESSMSEPGLIFSPLYILFSLSHYMQSYLGRNIRRHLLVHLDEVLHVHTHVIARALANLAASFAVDLGLWTLDAAPPAFLIFL